MEHGAALHMSYEQGRQIWRLSTGHPVPTEIAALVTAKDTVVPTGDGFVQKHTRPDLALRDDQDPVHQRRTTMTNLIKPTLVDEASAAAAAMNTPDPFDLASLRLNPSFTETAGVTKLLNTVPARRPNPQDFVRVHSAPEYRADFAMIDLKDDREDFLVRPEILPELTGEVVFKTIFTAINRQGVVFLWPVRLPAPDDRRNDWARSAREAAEMAMSRWVRMKSNRSLGAYEITVAESQMAEPEWPTLSFQELIRIAYRDRMISSRDHAVIKRLRGQT
jgi:hypothetical protein